MGDAAVVSLSVSASRDSDGRVNLSVVNLHPIRVAEVTATVWGRAINSITGEVLTAQTMNAMNTFDRPNTIKPVRFSGYKLRGSQLILTIPSKSVVVLALK
jgi:alpha-N-arabinofuranosidase